MKKAIVACLLFVGSIVSVEAETLHRWPLDYYVSPAYSRWFDHDHTVGYTRRYDGVINRLNDDEHHGTDILGNRSPTYIRAGFTGGLYYRWNTCDNNGYLGNLCGGSYGNHVRIRHNDGSGRVTIYAHMLQGVAWYQTILCSGTVGVMGNSGS